MDLSNPLTVRLQSCRALAVIITKTRVMSDSSEHTPLPDLFATKGTDGVDAIYFEFESTNFSPLNPFLSDCIELN